MPQVTNTNSAARASARPTWTRIPIHGTLLAMQAIAPIRRHRRPLPRVTSLFALLLALPLTLSAGCGEAETPAGEPGGPCLVGAEPCVEGYTCVSGVCTVVEPDAGVAQYSAQINLPGTRISGDGETAVEFDFVISTVPVDGERRAYDIETDGALFIAVIPSEAGRVSPARPVLVDGLGIADFVPCHRGDDPLCPEVATIRIARDDAPLEPIGESERITLTAPGPATPPDMGVDGGM